MRAYCVPGKVEPFSCVTCVVLDEVGAHGSDEQRDDGLGSDPVTHLANVGLWATVALAAWKDLLV